MNLIRFCIIVFSQHFARLDQIIVSAVQAEIFRIHGTRRNERERNCDSHWRKLLTFLLSVEGWCFKNNLHLLLPHINPNLMLCNPIRRERSTHGMFTFSGPLEDQTLLPCFQGVSCMPDLLQQRTFTVSLLQQLYQFLRTRTDYKAWPNPRSWCAVTLASNWKLVCPKSRGVGVRGKRKCMDS
jgi:hypothetical protein